MGRTRTDGPDEFEPTKFDCKSFLYLFQVTIVHKVPMKRSAVNQESTRIRLDKPLVKSVLPVITAITPWVL